MSEALQPVFGLPKDAVRLTLVVIVSPEGQLLRRHLTYRISLPFTRLGLSAAR